MKQTTTTWAVRTSKMNGSDTRISYFSTYKDALNFYAEKCDYHNISDESREWPALDTEVELSAGGRGYDYRIELLESEN